MANAEFDSAYFERMAALEDRHPWTRSMRLLTLDLLARSGARAGHCLLDAGCGTGLFLRDWKERFRSAGDVGIDYAWPALPLARRRTEAMLAGASASDLPLGPERFDAVHSADVLQHMTIAGARQALTEFRRVLRPAGLVALRLRATRRLIPNAPDVDFDHAYTPSLLARQMREAGFDVLFVRRVNLLPSLAAELIQRLRPVRQDDGAPVKGITLRDTADWRDQALAAYLRVERSWLGMGAPGLPVGHTIIAIGRKA
jgi:SAM-dependent methyltransferase